MENIMNITFSGVAKGGGYIPGALPKGFPARKAEEKPAGAGLGLQDAVAEFDKILERQQDAVYVKVIEKSADATREALSKVNGKSLQISIPRNSVVDIKIVDKKSGEVIQQLPLMKSDLRKIEVGYTNNGSKVVEVL